MIMIMTVTMISDDTDSTSLESHTRHTGVSRAMGVTVE